MLISKIFHKITKNWKRFRRWRREKRQKKYLSIRDFEAQVRGIEVKFSTEDYYSNQWFFPRYYGHKIHEQQVTELLLDTLEGKKCFVDVGTNLGWYTCLASKKLSNGIVYGFEMDDQNFQLVQKNIALNFCENVNIFHAAIADHSGKVQYLRNSKSPSPSFRIAAENEITNFQQPNLVTVPAYTLDDFFEEKKILPDVIKIDVEGAEFQVLTGMKNILSNKRPILFLEIHPKKLLFNCSVKDILTLMHSHGFQTYEISQMRDFNTHRELREIDINTPLLKNTMLYLYPKNSRFTK
jgi:FkbM family methyltransferase